MTDDAVDTTAIEGNSPVELLEQGGVLLGDMFSTDATALLALAEDVVATHT